jgi:hypothetical protein
MKLCRPAKLYLVLSLFAFVMIVMQNYGNVDKLCIGLLSCNIPQTHLVLGIDLLYIFFWTWILNMICDVGASFISWVLVLIPIMISFIVVGSMMTF